MVVAASTIRAFEVDELVVWVQSSHWLPLSEGQEPLGLYAVDEVLERVDEVVAVSIFKELEVELVD